MYDLVPPNMKAQFNSINSPNQSIKLSVNIYKNALNEKNLKSFSYNKTVIFKYSLIIKNSQIYLDIYPKTKITNHFNNTVLGSFVYDTSIKYSISQILIISDSKLVLENVIFGFLRKDYIYSKYKNNSKISKYKTNFSLSKNYLSLLNSLNFLKELVSEPSNIIYPTSFVKRTLKQINKKNINIKCLNKKDITRIGLNCLLSVSQGSQREPMVMEFSKKNKKKKC